MHTSRIVVAGVVLAVAGAVTLAAHQEPASPALAKALVAELGQKKQDCVLAKDPADAGRYVAALHMPGLQLLVVSAKFADPAPMDFRIFSADCMGGYADLNAAATATDRVIIADLGADGLVATPKKNAPRDGITRDGKELKLDGDAKVLKAAKMSAEDFQKTFGAADQVYSSYLKLLIARLKG